MVFKKSLEYKFTGYQLPGIPQVPQSAKGKRSARKKVEDDQMCAFDLLAAVAGKLLEKDDSSTSEIGTSKHVAKHEQLDEEKEKSYKDEGLEQVSCNESTSCSEVAIERQVCCALKDCSPILKATASEPVSATSKCDASVTAACTGELIASGNRNQYGYSCSATPKGCSTEGHYPDSVESRDTTGTRVVGNIKKSWILRHSSKVDAKSPALVSSDSSVEVPLLWNRVRSNSSFPKHRDDLELAVNRDDDENSSGCTHPSTMSSKALKPQHVGTHKIRKLFSNTETKTVLCSRKFCYTRQRTQRSLFKRRKVFERYSISSSGGGFLRKGVFNSIREETNETTKVTPSSASGQMPSYESENFHVKFSIRSFKVPELFIEIPETATVGSLKRTVVEAVTAVLGGGLHVGVLLQGKKVRDDNKTLLQAGISHGDRLDNLGFMLEPNSPGASPPFRTLEDPHSLLLSDAIEPVNRLPGAASASDPELVNASSGPLFTSVVNCPESDHGSVHSPMDASFPDKTKTNSRALVAVPPTDALSVVPSRKPKRSELAQRRIRRPFSVSEVEALVQAVEKLGTGRWRDVKLRAFDNAKHRTYVDLKDKWKTLVHTARISPQQRRGEPVPQELLDRVLAAHAHWSRQQAKLQVRTPTAEACLLY